MTDCPSSKQKVLFGLCTKIPEGTEPTFGGNKNKFKFIDFQGTSFNDLVAKLYLERG
jgi:hypothetical protein